jgi:hypothetical protein
MGLIQCHQLDTHKVTEMFESSMDVTVETSLTRDSKAAVKMNFNEKYCTRQLMITFNTLVEHNQVAKPQPSANLGKEAHNAEIQRTVGTTILRNNPLNL